MKVTALLPDKLMEEVKRYSGGKNTTEGLTIALNQWLSLKKLHHLNQKIQKKPLEFNHQFSAQEAREINRR
ncbi:MAG: hypothetical protein LDLANPLL_01396 [Turneriella sp.]|nr:hypothetical protein [Turneriella sp.]